METVPFTNSTQESANGLSKRIQDNDIDVEKATKDVIQTTKDLLYGRDDYPVDQQRLITKYGNNIIKSMKIGRTPLPSTITTLLNMATLGAFKKLVDKSPYDKLFHLFCIITLDNGSKILIEKNQAINMKAVSIYNPKNSEYMDVSIPNDLSFTDLLNNTRKKMGKNYFIYNASYNNCQDFIMNMLRTSSMLTNELSSFIKQDIISIFKQLPRTRKFMNTITQIGTGIDIVRKGLRI